MVNAVSPEIITCEEFHRVIAKKLNRPIWFKLPNWCLKVLLSEMSMLILGGQFVQSKVLNESSFKFKYQSLEKVVSTFVKRK